LASITRTRARSVEDSSSAEDMEIRLLEALERLLEKGENFTTISVERLAREAGISRATFYLYYRDKGDLISHLIHRVEDEVVAAGGMWFLRAEDAGYEDLRAAMRGFVEVYRKHRAVLRAAAETAAYDEEVDVVYQRMIDRFRKESRDAVARIASHGRAHADLPPLLADVLSWSVDHCYVKFGTTASGNDLDELIDALTHVVWYAIFSEKPAGAKK